MSDEKQESMADIVADIRERAENAMRNGERLVHNEAVARDNCRDCVHNPDGKNYEGGNAAAMRDALVRCDAIAQLPEVRNEQSIKDMRNIIKHALSAPARNCDLCDSYGDAIRAFEDTEDAEEYEDMAEWLLAPAERKGEGDGK